MREPCTAPEFCRLCGHVLLVKLQTGAWAERHDRCNHPSGPVLEALQVMVRDYRAAHASIGDLEMSPALLQAQRAIARATGEQP